MEQLPPSCWLTSLIQNAEGNDLLNQKHFEGSSCSAQSVHFAVLTSESYEALQRSSTSSVRVSVYCKGKCISCSLARKQKGELVLSLHRNGVAIARKYERHSKYKPNLFQCLDVGVQNCGEAGFSTQNIDLEPLEVGYSIILGSAGECHGQVVADWWLTGLCCAYSSALVSSCVVWAVA